MYYIIEDIWVLAYLYNDKMYNIGEIIIIDCTSTIISFTQFMVFNDSSEIKLRFGYLYFGCK